MSIEQNANSNSTPHPAATGNRGRFVVIGMFILGLISTGGLWTYWHLHLIPFMELQEAIVSEFPDSSPRVDGGQRKMHKGTVRKLRAVLKVAFDPLADDAETKATIEHYMTRYRALAEKHADLRAYTMLELHLYQPVREQELRQIIVRRLISTGQDVDEDGNPLPAKADSPPAAMNESTAD
ncbi:MAG: hypothetical protein KDA85_03660 [Planctomycetaceae bacterium]|nr:hypothetical protein [Planctomycetaceae bacterium]